MRISPLALATVQGKADVVKLLLEWGARRRVLDEKIAELGATPLELAEKDAHTDMVEFLQSPGGSKRPRRQTPVKSRVPQMWGSSCLAPTPAGVREAIDGGSPNTLREGKRKLQRHQKACQQKVDRAEAKAAGELSTRCKKLRKARADQAQSSYWRQKDAAKESAK